MIHISDDSFKQCKVGQETPKLDGEFVLGHLSCFVVDDEDDEDEHRDIRPYTQTHRQRQRWPAHFYMW